MTQVRKISQGRKWTGFVAGGVALVTVFAVACNGDDDSKKKKPAASASESRIVQLGVIDHPPIRESSGLAASRQHAGTFWTHNDSGNAPVLYAINQKGKLVGEFRVDASDDDWEDIAADDSGNLYIANTGNNKATRSELQVHRIAEPDPTTKSSGPLKPNHTWTLRFPADPFDCEALFIRGQTGYVISKLKKGRRAALYQFPLDGAKAVTLKLVATLPINSPVTSAGISGDGKKLAAVCKAGIYIFPIDGDLSRLADAKPTVIPPPPGKVEGLCFTSDGIILTSEGRDVFMLPLR